MVTHRRARDRALRPHGGDLQRARAVDRGEAVAAALPARRARRRRVVYLDPDIGLRRRWTRSIALCASTASCSRRTSPADAARRPQAQRDGHPHRGRLQPRLHRHRRRAPTPTSCSTGGASGSRRDCIVDPERGFFVDQRWIDLAPGLVAELPRAARPRLQRRLLEPADARPSSERDGDAGTVNGGAAALLPLQRLRPRAAAPALQAPGPDQARRRAGAARALRRATPRELRRRTASTRSSRWPYTYDATAVGHPARPRSRAGSTATSRPDGFDESLFDARRRGGVRRRCLRARRARPASPASPLPGGALRRPRADLQAALPRPRRPGRRPRLRRLGARRSGATRCRSRSPAAARPTGARARGPAPPASAPRRASRSASTSPATSTRSSASARSRARSSTRSTPRGVPVAAGRPRRRRAAARATRFAPRRRLAATRYPINLVCVNADMLPALAAQRRRRRSSRAATRSGCGGGRSRCSPSAGTAPSTTSTRSGPARSFVADALAAVVAGAGRAHADAGARSPPVRRADRARRSGCPSGFLVPVRLRLQQRASSARTRSGCIDAFLRAFPDPARARRWCSRASTPSTTPTSTTRLRAAAAGHPDVHLLDRYVSRRREGRD